MVTVKIITRTYYYSNRDDSLRLENIEVTFVQCGTKDALDLIEECNTNYTEGEQYNIYKTGDRRLTTCHAVVL